MSRTRRRVGYFVKINNIYYSSSNINTKAGIWMPVMETIKKDVSFQLSTLFYSMAINGHLNFDMFVFKWLNRRCIGFLNFKIVVRMCFYNINSNKIFLNVFKEVLSKQ